MSPITSGQININGIKTVVRAGQTDTRGRPAGGAPEGSSCMKFTTQIARHNMLEYLGTISNFQSFS